MPGGKGAHQEGSRASSTPGFRQARGVNFWAQYTIESSRSAQCPLTASRSCVTVSAPTVVKTNSHLASAGRRTRGSWPAGCGVYLSGDVRVSSCGQ